MITIIGSGPAGISTALYLKRANKEVQIITNNQSSLCKAHIVENYYGTGKIIGSELYEKGIESVKELNIPIIYDEVTNIEVNDNFNIVGLKDNYESDIVVLATGKGISKSKISGVDKFVGKGISYCATCDGFFFRNKKIALIGTSEYADKEYEYLKNITNDIIRLNEDEIKEVVGSTAVEKIILNNNEEIEINGIFICNEHVNTNVLCLKTGILTDETGIVINDKYETNIKNIYACGDCILGIKQISKAVNDGMLVANSIITK